MAPDRIVWHEKSAKKFEVVRRANAVKTRSDRDAERNDLEGVQDQGGKHGGQKGMPKPDPSPVTKREPGRGHGPDQGIVRDERGQEQPRDKERAQQVSRTDTIRR